LAGKIKKGLVYWGIDVFLAHEDIRASKQWQDDIVKNLRSCDVFMPLLTKRFRRSEWTDQESGMAVIESKIVMPLSITKIKPHGFLARYQAFKLKASALDRSCQGIVLAMKDNPELKTSVQDSFIRGLLRSSSFDEANAKTEFLEKLGPYNKRQVNEIVSGSVTNSQIYDGFTAKRKLRDFFLTNQTAVEGDLRRAFKERFGP
jgi:hypothetical protein